jgi:hypothetical protein
VTHASHYASRPPSVTSILTRRVDPPGNWWSIQHVPCWNTLPRTGRPARPASYPILQDKGRVSALEAKLNTQRGHEVYRQQQDTACLSDFDREIKQIEGKKP